uniref:Uncharacterized protein n=1 Tax=Caenorhabditis japonica TaxID=281687 RepID=A0A8R1DIZ0_CAEJA
MWNPFRKVISIVTGGRNVRTSSSSSETIENRVVYRWTASCLTAKCPIFAKNPQFNMIYSPVPSLLMFAVVILSSENAMTKTLQKLFELTDEDIDEIREVCSKLNDLRSPNSFYFFVRFLVDEEKTTTVGKELMAKSNDVAKQQVFASIRPARVIKYLSSLTFSPVTIARPSLLTTNGYGSAGLNAKWVGKTRKAGMHRFASSFSKKVMEPYFEIRTSYKRLVGELFELIAVPFEMAGATQGTIIFLRPLSLGLLPYANRQVSTEMINLILQDLSAATWLSGRLLLPQFTTTCQHDLWKNLMRHGVQPDLGQSQKAPPMASLWHWASLSVGREGLSGVVAKKGAGKTVATPPKTTQEDYRGRISGESLYKIHQPYAVRLDSAFTYIVQIHSIPVFTGSYFGSPPPKLSHILMRAPERIRDRQANRTEKRKGEKETRKQKLFRKLRKSEEQERAKDRKRAEREKKNLKRKSAEKTRKMSAEGTKSRSAETTKKLSAEGTKSRSAESANTGSAESATKEFPEKKSAESAGKPKKTVAAAPAKPSTATKLPAASKSTSNETDKRSQSKSSRWKRFKKRFFGRKQ